MTVEEIAKDILEQHLKTIFWDEGCLETLEKNIVDGINKYHQDKMKEIKECDCSFMKKASTNEIN